MLLTAEISLYPFDPEYTLPIKAYIEKLNQYDGIQVQTFPTATIIMGEYEVVMAVINDSIKWSYENFGRGVFVTKFVPDYQALK